MRVWKDRRLAGRRIKEKGLAWNLSGRFWRMKK